MNRKRLWRWGLGLLLGLLLALVAACGVRGLVALHHRDAPVDAVMMLGGSIKRELFVSQYARSHPDVPILISSGSLPPCIYLIFQRDRAPIDRVWLENCARSTFDNFYYDLPILERWGVRKVSLVTSESHLPRALWLAQIVFGSHGIWVEPNIVPEVGVPGNQESRLKTALDVTRSLLWAVASQVYSPTCGEELRLRDVDMAAWRSRGFRCERQAQIEEG